MTLAKRPLLLNTSTLLTAEELNQRIPGSHWEEMPVKKRICAYLDTFDWRLFNQGTVLEVAAGENGNRLTWRRLGSNEVLANLRIKGVPEDAESIVSPGLSKEIQAIIGQRALMQRTLISSSVHTLNLLNQEKKTTLRMEIREDGVSGDGNVAVKKLPICIYLFPMRGFKKEAALVTRRLLDQGMATEVEADPMLTAFQAGELVPGGYTKKPDLKLQPELPAHTALRAAFISLIDVMEANREGVCQNLDVEFLHDFLIAVRRTHCVLDLFFDASDSGVVNLVRNDFTWIEETAKPTRDMDIYLSLFRDYKNRLPNEYRKALDPLKRFLTEQRRKEHRKAQIAIESPRFSSLLKKWRFLLEEDPPPSWLVEGHQRTIRAMAGETIFKQQQKVTSKWRSLSGIGKQSDMLKLYQHCKRLGYLLEIFGKLYPQKRIEKIASDLHSLQDRLNRYHDLHLQASELRGAGSVMQRSQRVMPDWIKAIDLLAESLADEQRMVEKSLEKQLNSFSGKKTCKRFEALVNQ